MRSHVPTHEAASDAYHNGEPNSALTDPYALDFLSATSPVPPLALSLITLASPAMLSSFT